MSPYLHSRSDTCDEGGRCAQKKSKRRICLFVFDAQRQQKIGVIRGDGGEFFLFLPAQRGPRPREASHPESSADRVDFCWETLETRGIGAGCFYMSEHQHNDKGHWRIHGAPESGCVCAAKGNAYSSPATFPCRFGRREAELTCGARLAFVASRRCAAEMALAPTR